MKRHFNANGDNISNRAPAAPPPPPTQTTVQTFSAWLKNALKVEFGNNPTDINNYVLSAGFIGEISIDSVNYTYDYYNGEIEDWFQDYQAEVAGGQTTYNTQDVVSFQTGELIGQISTQNAINYNPLATATDHSPVMPSCDDKAAAVLYQNIIKYPNLLPLLDSDQINCLNNSTPYGFDEEAVADEFFDNEIDEQLGLDCLPDNWVDVLSNWTDNEEDTYSVNVTYLYNALLNFITTNPSSYPLCNEVETSTPESTPQVLGCTEPSAFNYDSNATVDDGSCYYPLTDEGEPFVPDTSIIATLGLTSDEYTLLIDDTIALIQQLQNELENCPEDQTATIEGLESDLAAAEAQVEELLSTQGILQAVENTLEQISQEGGCDSTSAAVSNAFSELNQAGANSDTVTALETLCTANDNITQADIDALVADLDDVYGQVGALYESLGLDTYGLTDYSIGNYDGSETTTNIFNQQIAVGTTNQNIDLLLEQLAVAIDGVDVTGADSEALEDALAALNSIANNLNLATTVTQFNIDSAQTQINNAINALEGAANSLVEVQSENNALLDQLQYVIDTLISALNSGGVTAPIYTEYEQIYNIITQQYVNIPNFESEISVGDYADEVYALVQTLVAGQQDPDLTATQDDLDDAYDNGFAAGADSVDITTDNQGVYDAAYDAGYLAGVASVTPEDGIGQADVDAAYADGFAAGALSITPEDGVNQDDVDAAYAEGYAAGYDDGFAAGQASVDITSDNQAVYDGAFADGVASVDITSDNQAAFDEGVASVDITADNEQAIQDAIAVGTELYNQIFNAGVDSVDITVDNQAAFDEGVASVDITTDNQAAFDEGVASVDITSDNQAAFDEGVASVDITSDNQAVADTAFAEGVASVQGQIEDLQAEIAQLLDGSGVSSQEAYTTLLEQVDNLEDQLLQAETNNAAWEQFLADLDVGMSRLEKFLRDSYGYDVNAAVPRATLTIPENMSDVNPNFLNEPLSDTSVYVGDGVAAASSAYQGYLDEFGGFAGKKPAEKKRLSGFLNMMGRAKKVRQGFLNFAGQDPFFRANGETEEEAEEPKFELTKGAKTGLYLLGGALAAFGIFKLVNKK